MVGPVRPGEAPIARCSVFKDRFPFRGGLPLVRAPFRARPARYLLAVTGSSPGAERTQECSRAHGRSGRRRPPAPLRRARAAGGAACRPGARLRRAAPAPGRGRPPQHLAVEPHGPLADQPPRLARGEAELVRDQRRQVDRPAAAAKPATWISSGSSRRTWTWSKRCSAASPAPSPWKRSVSRRASSRFVSTAGRPVERLREQQQVVLAHRRVGDAHQLPEHLVRRIGHPDVVVVGLAHLQLAVGPRQDRHRQDRLRRCRRPPGRRVRTAG